MTDHEHWDELAAGYALDALSEEEATEFRTHLETCPECARSLAEHELVAAQLGSISHYQETDQPPSWESIRDAILGERAPAADVADLDAHRRRFNLSRRVLATAAAAVIVAGGGVAFWQATSNSSSSCSVSAGCHEINLDAAGGKTLASAVVRDNSITVTPTNMPDAPTGKTYVLWQQPVNGSPTPLGEFTAGTGATATATLTTPLDDTAGFAVSLENAGTPPATPSDTLASGATA